MASPFRVEEVKDRGRDRCQPISVLVEAEKLKQTRRVGEHLVVPRRRQRLGTTPARGCSTFRRIGAPVESTVVTSKPSRLSSTFELLSSARPVSHLTVMCSVGREGRSLGSDSDRSIFVPIKPGA